MAWVFEHLKIKEKCVLEIVTMDTLLFIRTFSA